MISNVYRQTGLSPKRLHTVLNSELGRLRFSHAARYGIYGAMRRRVLCRTLPHGAGSGVKGLSVA